MGDEIGGVGGVSNGRSGLDESGEGSNAGEAEENVVE